MIRFEYKRPTSIEACLELLDLYGKKAKLIAGGTDLMVEMRDDDKKRLGVEIVIDTTHIAELKFIDVEDDMINLGPGITHEEIWENPFLNEYAPFLCEACHSVGSPQIRHAGTVGGSIGTASPASDPLPPLVALGAFIVLASVNGTREVLLEDLLLKPYVTDIAENELIVSIRIPIMNPEAGYSFVKLGRRKALAISRMNVATYVELDEEGKAVEVRIVPGSCMPTAVRIKSAEEMLLGQKPSYALHKAIGEKVAEEMVSVTGRRWSTPYKEPVIASLVKRSLNEATGVSENE
ncbi:FAD binding domain-containing protein [Clostridia bacterium]|nr:FAD binding domain-containing protein [Clostridia bacterium]